jgi:hypothetical protein
MPGPISFQYDKDVTITAIQGEMPYSSLAPELEWHDLDLQSLLLKDDVTMARAARNSMIFCSVILRNWGGLDACSVWFVHL